MSTHGNNWSLDEALQRMEQEIRQAIQYVNDAVVPEVRSESIAGLRRIAAALGKLADHMEAPARGPRPE